MLKHCKRFWGAKGQYVKPGKARKHGCEDVKM
jgi:hypothetical protein